MLDLNLLRVLATVIEQRTITAAADHLQLSQPAITQSLNRLRKIAQDPLFIKSGRGVAPTRIALQIYNDTAPHIAGAESAVTRIIDFEPSTTSTTFRISLTDIGHEVFLPPLARRLQQLAPRSRLEVTPPDANTVTEQLESGELDAAVLSTDLDGKLRSEFVHQGEYLCVTRTGLFSAPGPGLNLLKHHPRVAVTGSTGHTLIEQHLAVPAPGSILVSSFGSIPDIVSSTDLVAFAPQVLIRHWVKDWDIDVWDIHEIETRTAVRAYFPMVERSPASAWFNGIMVSALREAPLLSP